MKITWSLDLESKKRRKVIEVFSAMIILIYL